MLKMFKFCIFLGFFFIFLHNSLFVTSFDFSKKEENRISLKNSNISSYDEEYRIFENEQEKLPSISKSRGKRYIYLNVQSNLDVGFLCVIPISIVLPKMSNLFNSWRRRRRRRSVGNEEAEIWPDFTQEKNNNPMIQPALDKILWYFELLNVSKRLKGLSKIRGNGRNSSPYMRALDYIHSTDDLVNM
jgi:hypothetical protein